MTPIYAGVSPELLTSLPSNSVSGLDNATFHQRGDALAAIEKAGQIVGFLPPDSPDLNPIGKKWAPAKVSDLSLEIHRRNFCQILIYDV